MQTKETIAKAPSGRVKRTPIQGRNVLTVTGKDPEYHYRIVNDDGDRVQMFIDGGYEIESAVNINVGDKSVGKASSEGSKAQVSVGKGIKAFVMKIRKDWFDEDQATKQEAVDNLERTTKQQALDGTYGKLDLTRDK
jgi:hypothetical protein